MTAVVLATVAFLLLIVAGIAHARSLLNAEGRANFRRLLVAHAVVPNSFHRLVTWALPAVELLLGTCGLATLWLSANGSAVRIFGVAVVAMYTAFAVYGLLVLGVGGSQLECGCGASESPMGAAVISRAVLLVVGAAGVFRVSEDAHRIITSQSALGHMMAFAVIAGLAVVLWVYPRALARPLVTRVPSVKVVIDD